MTLLDFRFNDIQLEDNSDILLEFDFDSRKTFQFTLTNPAPKDLIYDIVLITNLPDEIITAQNIPKQLGPLASSIARIEFDADALERFYENNPNFKPKIGFTYNRKRFMF
jgi:hypothetical protein